MKQPEQIHKEKALDLVFERVLKDKHTRVEFIRKGRGNQPRRKIGVMISCISPIHPNKVIIGFSLCHDEFDEFNKIKFGEIPFKNFGKLIAFKRAIKWSDVELSAVYDRKLLERNSDIVYIPATVHYNLANFILSSYYYYKDKNFPEWVLDYFPKPEPKPEEEGDVRPVS